MRKCIVIMLLLSLVTVPTFTNDYDGNMLYNAANWWSELNQSARAMYVQGVLVGLYAVYNASIDAKQYETAARVETVIPYGRTTEEIMNVVSKAYHFDEYRQMPVWYIIVNIDAMITEMRKKGGNVWVD